MLKDGLSLRHCSLASFVVAALSATLLVDIVGCDELMSSRPPVGETSKELFKGLFNLKSANSS